jgi:predicted  nucleic acid-binding Zn-ribbon protein
MNFFIVNTILLLLIAAYLISYVVFKREKREGLENYQDYSGNADEMKILVYKNAGNIAALKDAIDKLMDTTNDAQGRISSLEKDHENLNNVVQATKAMADETKANVDSAVTEYKAQGDEQTNALNDVTFDEE